MRSDAQRLSDIITAIDNIDRYTADGWKAYAEDELIQVWVLFHMVLIGEAARQLTKGKERLWPKVPWADTINLRNLIVHEYFDLDLIVIWDTATEALPVLRAQIQELLASLPPD